MLDLPFRRFVCRSSPALNLPFYCFDLFCFVGFAVKTTCLSPRLKTKANGKAFSEHTHKFMQFFYWSNILFGDELAHDLINQSANWSDHCGAILIEAILKVGQICLKQGQFSTKGSRALRKTIKRWHCPLLATPPPKRVKRGHLSSENIKLI